MIQLDALKKRPERHTHRHTNRNWHVGPVLTSLALDKNLWICPSYFPLSVPTKHTCSWSTRVEAYRSTYVWLVPQASISVWNVCFFPWYLMPGKWSKNAIFACFCRNLTCYCKLPGKQLFQFSFIGLDFSYRYRISYSRNFTNTLLYALQCYYRVSVSSHTLLSKPRPYLNTTSNNLTVVGFDTNMTFYTPSSKPTLSHHPGTILKIWKIRNKLNET